MKKLNTEQMKTLIIATILIIIGILFCCSHVMGIIGLSVLCGLIILITGILFVVKSIINNKTFLNTSGIIGIMLISLSILFMVNKIASIILLFIPWFLIVFGCILIIDSLLGKFVRKEDNLTEFIIKIILGAVSIILGLCLKLIDQFFEYACVILGIVMIIYSIYMIFTIFKNSLKNQ